MAIDFLILALLLVSFVTNFLALAAFWITPGLRTTANRFTINLLIINVIGCLILAPTLFLSNSSFSNSLAGGSGGSAASDGSAPVHTFTLNDLPDRETISFSEKAGNHQMTIKHNDKVIVKEGFFIQNKNDSKEETFYKCNGTMCQERSITESQDSIVITDWLETEKPEAEELTTIKPPPLSLDSIPPVAMRCWSIDMAAALGALAVLLVVGDTWCAVTDPLRYHSRISGVKTWVFIALTWTIGILFGALSAFRVFDFESRRVILNSNYFAFNSTNAIFSMIFSCVYFVVIILLPFGFVCGMYWRIFSEARENGLRMRQNGSSPLLQSALNLTHQQNSTPTLQQFSNQPNLQRCSISSSGSSHNGDIKAGSTGGLHMQIDTRSKNSPSCLRRDSAAKVLLPTISDDGASDDAEADADSTCDQLVTVPEHSANLNDGNHNILLTLQTASGEIKRNYSARQLPLLGASSQDFKTTSGLQGIRQVHSSPNLHKYTQIRDDNLAAEERCSPHLLLPGQHHLQPSLHHLQRHQHFCSTGHRPHSHPPRLQYSHNQSALQIPSIHSSPKSLSYMSSLRHRLSNASSLFKYREESRAARISILVVIMFLVSYLPYGFLVLLQSRLSIANFESSTRLAIFMILLANLSSAFIFAYRNKRVRRGVKRLCGLEGRCQDKSLKRQSTSSLKGSTILRQNSKKALAGNSAANRNSCKFLSPQTSLLSNGIKNGDIGILKPNTSCSTIVNIQESSMEAQEARSQREKNLMQIPLNTNLEVQKSCLSRPKLQRGITIVEQLPSPGQKFKTKSKSFFNLFFKSSKQLKAYSATQNSAKENVVPTEV